MKVKKITAVLLIVLMLLSLNPINVPACVPDPTPITVTVNVDQKHGNDTHDFANYTLDLTQAQSDALALLSNISLSDALYNLYGVLEDKFAQPVNSSDLYGDGQIVYQQIDATHYYVYILLKEGGPFYNVTFLTSIGGSFAAGAQTVFSGIENGTRWNNVPIVVPATVANTGYEFNAWTPSIPTNNPKIKQDLTYTASFNLVTYHINYFNLNGASNPNPGSYNVTTPTITLSNLSKTGYYFLGWYATSDFSGPQVTEIPQGSTGDINLYAKWTNEKFVINFVSGGHGTLTGQTSFTNILYGSIWSTKVTEPGKNAATGYQFDYWSPSLPAANSQITSSQQYTAHFAAIDYTITYNNILFTDTNNNPAGYNIESSTINLLNPTRLGWTFQGWYDNAGLTGTAVTNIPTGSTGNKTFYAKWTQDEYSITYNNILPTDTNTNPATYKEDQTPITLSDAARLGYTFGGWYDNAGLTGTPVTAVAEGTTGNLTYWAKWTKDESLWNDVTFTTDGNGTLTGTTSFTDILEGTIWNSVITVPTPTANTGYEFNVWSPILPATDSAINDDATYTATFNAIDYDINYVLNGGANNAANPTSYNIESSTITLQDPSFYGWTFLGWYDNEGLTGTAVTNIPAGSTGDKKFYAKWEKDASLWYDVTFTTNGHGTLSSPASFTDILDGTVWNTVITVPTPVANLGYKLGAWSPSLPDGTSQIKSDLTFTYNFKAIKYDINYVLKGGINDWRNPNKYTIEDTVNFYNPYRLGYIFQGWYATSDYTGSPVTGISQGSTGNVKLYAKWEKDPFYWNDVNFTTDGHGTLSGTTSYTDIFLGTPWFLAIDSVPTPVADTGYEFNAWSPELPKWYSLIWSDATYMADFVPIDYTITYVLNGGVNDSNNLTGYNIETPTITLLDPSFYGWTFLGWYDNEGLTGTAVTSIPTGSTGDKKFYAKWEKDESLWNDVTFTTDGNGTLSSPASFTDILEGTIWNSVITVPTPTANTGYEFNVWSPILPATDSAIKDDATYTATFNAIDYDINYVLNGGANNAANPTSYNIESSTITLQDPSFYGWTFLGWYDNEGLTGTKITSIPAGSTGDKKFYAKWEKDASLWYDVNFVTDGNGTLTGTTSFTDILNGTIWNTVVTVPTTTAKAGYVFNGWIPVLPAATSAITKDVTYKATFKAIVYDITYVLNDGTNSPDNPETYTINSGTITFANPTKDGYTFDGWYSNADFTGAKVTKIAAGSTGDRTLYAKWTANTIIDDNPVPLTPGTPVLTLIDLFCAILTLIGMIYMFTSKKNADDENTARRRKATRITGIILAAIGVILFFITQPLVWNFRWVDKWTVLFIIVTLAQAAAIYIKNKANKAEATQE